MSEVNNRVCCAAEKEIKDGLKRQGVQKVRGLLGGLQKAFNQELRLLACSHKAISA